MTRRQIARIFSVLLSGIVMAACGNSSADDMPAQPLTLATPVAIVGGSNTGLTLPEQIVVVIVTPTPAQDSGEQQDQGQQAQGQVEQQPAESGEGSENQVNGQELIRMGEQIYSTNCASCHQANGEGTTSYPSLAGSEALTGEDPSAVIQIVVDGRGQMPAFGDSLSTEEIAAVISYERNSWGNDAGVVTAAQVTQVQEGGSAQEQPAPSPAAQDEAEATPPPAPENSGQGGGDAESQATPTNMPANGESQASTSPAQPGNVVTIRIEIVVVTPEVGASPAIPTPSPESTGEAETTATAEPTGEVQTTPEPDDGSAEQSAAPEASAGEDQATSTNESAETQATPAPQDTTQQPEESQAAVSQEGGEPTEAQPAASIVTVLAGGTESSADAVIQIQIVVVTPAPSGGTITPTVESSGGQQTPSAEQPEATATPEAETPAQEDSENGDGAPSEEEASDEEASDEEAATVAPIQQVVVMTGSGGMPHFKQFLETPEIAAIISYLLNSWSNRGSAVTVAN